MTVMWSKGGYNNTLEPFDETMYEYWNVTYAYNTDSPVPVGDGWMEIDWHRPDAGVQESLWRRLKVQNKTPIRNKFCYIGVPKLFELDLACRPIVESFDSYGLYLVGSALLRPNFRDVDLRMIMADESFAAEFPDAHGDGSFSLDTKWMLLTASISGFLSKQTSLPIDFQFQPQSYANTYHNKERHPLGNKMPPKESVKET